ncbi:MAG: undecaprenyl-diphosphate phosphatase [Pirellulales bacterium]|nr:undecaprenyl-diphosphate phosphatase [Pirellulales bacterium]
MMLLEILFLAVVQGITEFLPVSSSGHLVVLTSLFNQYGHPIPESLTVEIILHLGTLGAVLVFYWRRIWQLLGEDRRVIGLLIVGTLPAAVVGPLLKKYGIDALENPVVAGLMFFVTAGLLLWTRRHQSGEMTCREMTYKQALLIGVFQAFAILPGVSRSGSTIVAGLGVGLRRDEAAAFSFLLAIPAIGGAGLLDILKLMKEPTHAVPIANLVLGAVVSFVVGLAALAWLVRWLQHGRLYYFAWWLLILGPAVLVWQWLG